jgi:Zn-dependent metalloprotease
MGSRFAWPALVILLACAASVSARALEQTSAAKPAGPPAPAATEAAKPHPGLVTIEATEAPARDEWDGRVAQMLKVGDAVMKDSTSDAIVKGRTLQHLAQLYKGVGVVGGDITRVVENQRTVSIFGTIYKDIDIDPVPKLTTAEAADVFQKLSGDSLGPSLPPELMVLPMADGTYRLTYRSLVATADASLWYFIDAGTGETVLTVEELKKPNP